MTTVIEVTAPGELTVEVTPADVVEVDVVAAAPIDIEVAVGGVPGPAGPAGPPATFRHVQSTPSASWSITHNLGKQVLPTLVLDEDPGVPVFTDVVFVDDNSCIVIWPNPVTGRADW